MVAFFGIGILILDQKHGLQMAWNDSTRLGISIKVTPIANSLRSQGELFHDKCKSS